MGNEKKLDKSKKDDVMAFLEEEPDFTADIVDGEDMFDEEPLEFDEDGNILGLEDGEPEQTEQPDTDTETDKQPELAKDVPIEKVEVQTEKDKVNKSPTPADIKVINLKKENKLLQQQLADALKVKQQQELEQEKDKLRVSYEEQGYDKDTAKTMSENEIRLRQLEEQLEVANFRTENLDILTLYPEAKTNISSIMRNSKLTGMTVEQICKGLYGTPTVSDSENRAIMAAKGQSTRTVDNAKSSIIPTKNETSEVLSVAQQKEKVFLERLNGGKLTIEEYKKYSRL